MLTEVFLGIAILAIVLPVAWMLVLAVQPAKNIVSGDWQFGFSLSNLQSLFAFGQPFATQYVNSIIIVAGTVVLCLLVGTLAGYSLASLGWSPKMTAALLAVAAIIPVVPPMAMVPGLYSTLQNLGLLGSIPGLIMLNTVFNLPFTVVLMKVYFGSVPVELREAALIDGASELLTFRKVMLPVVAPGAAAAAIYTAIMTWNEFLFGLTMTSGGTTSPITVGIAALVQPYEAKWGEMAAAGSITAIPIILLAIIARRRIVTGMTRGAVKG
ncbi:MAG: ABC transporter permease subunit [Streptosporangiales bacterium]|nr:ABC transporter permease subunit [Streptosporangiales bacterium]